MKKVSIIIVTYNSEGDIFDCVRSIQEYCDIPKNMVELIIVDNQSRNPQPMFSTLREMWGDDIICISNDRNGGYGQGNNVGIRQATAPVLLIMNPDVRLHSPFFAAPLSKFSSDHQLVMYGMKMMYTPERPSTNSFCCTYMMNGYMRAVLEALTNRIGIYIPRWQYFSGSCFFVRKRMFEEVGLFDEEVFMYGEEDDIHYRLMKRFGPHFHYNPHLQYLHLVGDRKPDPDYEKKIVDVALFQNAKKGYSHQKTLQNLLRLYSIRLWREWIKVKLGKDIALYNTFASVVHYIKQLQKQYS